MTWNGNPSVLIDNTEGGQCEGFVTVQPGGTILRAYASTGPVAAIIDPDDPSTFDAPDIGDFSLSLYGLAIDGHDCLLSVVARRGEASGADVVEISLSPFATLDEVIAFQAQDRRVTLVLAHVAVDIGSGGLSVAGVIVVDARRWTFEGHLRRARRVMRTQRVTNVAIPATFKGLK